MVTGRLPRVLIAVEETVSDGRRVLRMPTVHDHHALDRAAELRPPHIAGTSLDGVDGGRPKSYGFATAGDLFSDRQAVVLAAAFAWVESQKLKEPLAQALRLAVSNAIASNNLLCGYATDYGRLAPAFYGVKSYSMPVLAVELNPLHATAGRGTIEATLRRVQRAAAETVRRHRHDSADGEIRPHAFTARRAARYVVRCQSADRRFPADLGLLDAAITDPPYFDFIPYSDLSLLHRAWLPDGARLTGAPIFPVGDEPVTQFAKQLGRAFQRVSDALGQGAPVAFTYHSSHPKAWQGLHGGLRQAKLGVSAIYPVWADGRAASHGHAGNCEWDLVFVCRPDREITTTNVPRDITGWLAELQRWDISTADRESMSLGLGVAQAMSSHGRRKRDELSSAGSGQPRPRSA
jgi:adenine-specific DNA methylase